MGWESQGQIETGMRRRTFTLNICFSGWWEEKDPSASAQSEPWSAAAASLLIGWLVWWRVCRLCANSGFAMRVGLVSQSSPIMDWAQLPPLCSKAKTISLSGCEHGPACLQQTLSPCTYSPYSPWPVGKASGGDGGGQSYSSAGPRRCRFYPWVGKIPRKRKWQPPPVFLLKNPMDRGAWQAIVQRVTTVGHEWATKHWKESVFQPVKTACPRGQVVSVNRAKFSWPPAWVRLSPWPTRFYSMQPWRPFQLPLLPFPGTCSLTPAVLALHLLWTHDTCSSLMTCALVPLPGAFLTTSPNCDIFSVQVSSSPRAFWLLNPHYPTQSALSSCSLLYPLSRTFYCFVGFFTLFLPSSLQGGTLALLFGASPKAQETVWCRDDGRWCFWSGHTSLFQGLWATGPQWTSSFPRASGLTAYHSPHTFKYTNLKLWKIY